MKNSQPQVSVIIPVFNREWCIGDAIKSVIDTHYSNLEILIIDDGSRDGTQKILDEFEKHNSSIVRVLHHQNGENRGAAASRNLGLKEASGEYIAFLDSDDLYYSNRFTYCIPWLENRSDIFAGIEPYCTSQHGKNDPKIFHPHLTRVENQRDFFDKMLFESIFWKMPTITFKKKIFSLVEGFDENQKFTEETSLWLRVAALQSVASVQEKTPVCEVRRHQERLYAPGIRDGLLTYHEAIISTAKWAKRNKKILKNPETILCKLLKRANLFFYESSSYQELSAFDRMNFLYDIVKIYPKFTLEKSFFRICWSIAKYVAKPKNR